jgi:predicted nucleic acid-binding protein
MGKSLTNPLFVDANILVRCVVGKAMFNVDDLLAKGAVLATTDAQAREAKRVLHHIFEISEHDAEEQINATVSAMELYEAPTYRAQEASAKARIHYKNTKDWPILAAAIEHGGAIWTDDRDFFGTGVPTWTTRNIKYVGTANV